MYSLWIGTTINTITIPIIPATPISAHNNPPTIRVSNGAVHIEFKNIVTQSNRLTSFERRLTTLPGAVSPSAVCESRNA